MFEPENDIERALMRAAHEPAALRTGIPLIAAKRGILSKLFG
jgi:hypothetical protein